MNYKITLADGTAQLIQITADYFKAWPVWRIQFSDGKAAMLHKFGNEWMQRNEDFLDRTILNTIGEFIDRVLLNNNVNPAF